ncbi:hypothetical protein NC652_021621 [Populus alba x Populus x berolinensis]|uniref:Uncharacterized protein n=1 Tax=Populus alba x Populus x berolinensis TaxID=444605 RepID=A0AAD6QEW9_9ROSI|nr:hypothetical protein NC652_021621 [Populus alba x Populus x berolinensis]KAJ6988448.1 hypothetical protein NC653_021386 [Populus alba x Populus x berolinensis]
MCTSWNECCPWGHIQVARSHVSSSTISPLKIKYFVPLSIA